MKKFSICFDPEPTCDDWSHETLIYEYEGNLPPWVYRESHDNFTEKRSIFKIDSCPDGKFRDQAIYYLESIGELYKLYIHDNFSEYAEAENKAMEYIRKVYPDDSMCFTDYWDHRVMRAFKPLNQTQNSTVI